MNEFKQYKRTQIAEMRKVTQDEVDNPYSFVDKNISISQADLDNGSPKIGDMIARNPKNHADQWLVSEQYYKDNFEDIVPEDFMTRLLKEKEFVHDNLEKLNHFIEMRMQDSNVDQLSQFLLINQRQAMALYYGYLTARIDVLCNNK